MDSTNFSGKSNSIYINPNFNRQKIVPLQLLPRSAHINPLFLRKTKEIEDKPPTIHMNPQFFARKLQQLPVFPDKIQNMPKEKEPALSKVADKGKIICKSKNRLIREPLHKKPEVSVAKPIAVPLKQAPLLVLNKRKLVRTTCNLKPAELSKTKSTSRITKYKVDNRSNSVLVTPTSISRKRLTSYVGQYSLRRSNSNVLKKSSILFKKHMPFNARTLDKNLKFLNINGLLYKSTRNSLKLKNHDNFSKKTVSAIKPTLKLNKPAVNSLTIFVRGTKYILDSKKCKLTRVGAPTAPAALTLNTTVANTALQSKPTSVAHPRRIDIGGYTYVSASSGNNVFIRTASYLSRAHVYSAKQKSLHLLSKRLVKSNIPCPIFQRIGKCAAFERGKCSKVHDKLNVAICQK